MNETIKLRIDNKESATKAVGSGRNLAVSAQQMSSARQNFKDQFMIYKNSVPQAPTPEPVIEDPVVNPVNEAPSVVSPTPVMENPAPINMAPPVETPVMPEAPVAPAPATPEVAMSTELPPVVETPVNVVPEAPTEVVVPEQAVTASTVSVESPAVSEVVEPPVVSPVEQVAQVPPAPVSSNDPEELRREIMQCNAEMKQKINAIRDEFNKALSEALTTYSESILKLMTQAEEKKIDISTLVVSESVPESTVTPLDIQMPDASSLQPKVGVANNEPTVINLEPAGVVPAPMNNVPVNNGMGGENLNVAPSTFDFQPVGAPEPLENGQQLTLTKTA